MNNYTIKTVKKTICTKNEPIMIINMNYPVFEKNGNGKFAEKINKFYQHTAEKYSSYIARKYPKKAEKIFASNGQIKLSFLMNCTVSFCSDDIISVFSDLTYFDGTKKKTARFSQNWSAVKSALLPPSFLFNINRKSKNHITEIITEIASSNMKTNNFSYYSGFDKIIRHKFDFENFYFVPKGTAFFYNAGVLSEADTPSVFVIPNKKIDGVMKISI